MNVNQLKNAPLPFWFCFMALRYIETWRNAKKGYKKEYESHIVMLFRWRLFPRSMSLLVPINPGDDNLGLADTLVPPRYFKSALIQIFKFQKIFCEKIF